MNRVLTGIRWQATLWNSVAGYAFAYSSTDSKRVIAILAQTDLDSAALDARKDAVGGMRSAHRGAINFHPGRKNNLTPVRSPQVTTPPIGAQIFKTRTRRLGSSGQECDRQTLLNLAIRRTRNLHRNSLEIANVGNPDHQSQEEIDHPNKIDQPQSLQSLRAANTRAHPSSATAGERIHKPRRYPQTDA